MLHQDSEEMPYTSDTVTCMIVPVFLHSNPFPLKQNSSFIDCMLLSTTITWGMWRYIVRWAWLSVSKVSCSITHRSLSLLGTCSWCYDPGPYFFHFLPFLPICFVHLVTHSPPIPSHAVQTATTSPDKSPDESPDYSAAYYHMPLLQSHCPPLMEVLAHSSLLFTHYGLPAYCQFMMELQYT